MADPLPRSEVFWLLAGVGVIGAVVFLANRQSGNTLQPTPPATATTASGTQQAAPIATNSLAYDMTALSDPLTSIPTSAYGGSMTSPGQYVELPSGSTVPFIPGIQYAIGSIIHYGDGTVAIQ
jgi:hypothetical protein